MIREERWAGWPALVLEDGPVRLTVLPGKGGDISSWQFEGTELLWQAPWGWLPPGAGFGGPDPVASWIDHYEGGWQDLFPNGGPPCEYKGLMLHFHGEASTLPWIAASDGESLCLTVTLRRSPFRLERRLRLTEGVLRLTETATNLAEEPMAFMWGQHLAFGAPLVAPGARVDTPAAWVENWGPEAPAASQLAVGRFAWPKVPALAGGSEDLSLVPPNSLRTADMTFLGGFGQGPAWAALTNPDLGLGAGLVWEAAAMPYLWLWRELRGSFGYPWYGRTTVIGLEPFTSFPGGLSHALANRTAMLLQPGGQAAIALKAVAFRGRSRVAGIDAEGGVTFA